MVHEQDRTFCASVTCLHFNKVTRGLIGLWREKGTKFLLDAFVSCFHGILACVQRAGKCETPFKLYIYPNVSYFYF